MKKIIILGAVTLFLVMVVVSCAFSGEKENENAPALLKSSVIVEEKKETGTDLFSNEDGQIETLEPSIPVENGEDLPEEKEEFADWQVSFQVTSVTNFQFWKKNPEEKFGRISDYESWEKLLADYQEPKESVDTLKECYNEEFFEQYDLVLCGLKTGESTYKIIETVGHIRESQYVLEVKLLTMPAMKDDELEWEYVIMNDSEQTWNFFIEVPKQHSTGIESFHVQVKEVEHAETVEQFLAIQDNLFCTD